MSGDYPSEKARSSSALKRLDDLAGSIAVRSEAHRGPEVAAISMMYLILAGLIAARKPLENDELFTLNIARLPSLTDVWGALLTGAEQMPPLFYVITRASLALLGENGFALRLPGMLGILVMGISLFLFVSKRGTAIQGLAAMLFPLTTAAYYYSFEARPYGLVLGFAGLGLISWQALADESGRRPALLIGLALSLAAAISSHYYAVLIVIPFLCGEAARALVRRRLDLPVLAAIAVSMTPLLFHLPLIRSARSYSTAFWAQPKWGDIPDFFNFLLASAVLPLTAMLLLTVAWSLLAPAMETEREPAPGLLMHEFFVAIGFIAIPIAAVVIAMFVTRAFTYRYALSAVIGLTVLIPPAFKRSGSHLLPVLLVLLLLMGVARRGGLTLQDAARRTAEIEAEIALLLRDDHGDLPVVCSDPHAFLMLSHNAPAGLRSRLVYLGDVSESMRYLGHNSLERGMFDLLKPWFGLNVQSYRSFLKPGRRFLLFGDPFHFLNWVLPDLQTSGAGIELAGKHRDSMLFLVSSDGEPGPASIGESAESRGGT